MTCAHDVAAAYCLAMAEVWVARPDAERLARSKAGRGSYAAIKRHYRSALERHLVVRARLLPTGRSKHQDVGKSGIPRASGARDRWFKSSRPD